MINWPDFKIPPINLWNVWILEESKKVPKNNKEVVSATEINPKIKKLMRILNDRYRF